MKRRKSLWVTGILCLLLYALSVYFFITREKTGNYVKQVTYEDLYAPASNTPEKLKKWQSVTDQYSPVEISKGKELTRLNAGIGENDPVFTKMLKIASWLQRSYRHCKQDEPTKEFSALSLTDQYAAALRAESPVWCHTYGMHFLFFCSINGITSRVIEKKGGNDYHTMNEFYIPELKQWVFADLMLNAFYCQDEKGKILNIIDLLYKNENKDSSQITIFSQEPVDSFSIIPHKSNQQWQRYLKKDAWLNFYYQTDTLQVYTPVKKAVRYAFPVAWHETFSLTPISNTQFYLRILSLYLGIVLTIIFILLYLKRND